MKRRTDSEDDSPHSKRQKLTESGSGKPQSEAVSSLRQLQSILRFHQDAGPNTKQNIHAFKTFLESITYGQDPALQSSSREVLLEYLNLQPFAHGDKDSANHFDLVETWSFAAQSNKEAVFNAVTTVLALLLETISHHVDFRGVGKSICQLLLHNDHLKLIERGLSARKSKGHVISPFLRLLTEIVLFDGGSSAKRVHRTKDITLKRLDSFLGLRHEARTTESKKRKKPSVRDDALRYLFSNLRLQDHSAKVDVLANGRILRSIFQDINEDSPSIVREILESVRKDILEDDRIPRRIKGRIFTEQVLSSIATLFSYRSDNQSDQHQEPNQQHETIPGLAYAFLVSVCTTPSFGILNQQVLKGDGAEGDGVDPFNGLDRATFASSSKPPSKPMATSNHTISSFLQTLRPYANVLQRDLVLAIFQAAPELVFDYFNRKKSFSFDPKLTATWVGFAAFLLSTIQLPVHNHLANLNGNGSLPMPISEVIESILPRQLSPKVLSRCFNQKVTVIKFFTTKILSAAFDKFAATLHCIRSAAQNAHGVHRERWKSTASVLVEEFSQRCPDMSHVVAMFRTCSTDDTVLREASARLLSLYYQHLPQTALEQKFDVSTYLSTAFDDIRLIMQSPGDAGLESLTFERLLYIAKCSPDVRMWQKPDQEKLSLFGSGFRLYATRWAKHLHHSLEELLRSALSEGLSLEPEDANLLLAGLLKSMSKFKEWKPSDALFEFLDDCFTRLSKKAVMYHQDLLEKIVDSQPDDTSKTMHLGGEILVVVMEQWPFMQASVTKPDLENISRWLSHFLGILERQGTDPKFIRDVRHCLKTIAWDKRCGELLKKVPSENIHDRSDGDLREPATPTSSPHVTLVGSELKKASGQDQEWEPPIPPASEDEDHPGLSRWKQMDIEEAIIEGATGELILCLCSRHADIRKQALIAIRSWMKKLEVSRYSEREALYLLAGELIETVQDLVGDTALPYFTGVAAAEFCRVQSDPLHYLYGKVNKFLNKGPAWKVERMPSYWVDQILLNLPTNDDAHYKEMGWLLDLLIEGLRTREDMELYRQSHILERLLSLLTSPSLQPPYQEKILTILFRCAYAGGSTTLITRYSLLSWVQCCIASSTVTGSRAVALDRLAQHCKMTCDKKRVHEWSGGELGATDAVESK